MAEGRARENNPLLDWLFRPRSTTVEEVAPAASDGVDLEGEEEVCLPRLPGRFDDEGLLGSGGMGAVRVARDIALRREVAMKLLNPRLAKRPAMVQTFIEEARIVGQLDHAHIPPVHELGADENGVVYFTMKVVRGSTLWKKLRDPDRPPGSPERLREGIEVVQKVCDALSFAHSKGVLHRDIKPDNIMVGDFGEVYLMDWGLAKVLRDRATVDVPRDAESPLGKSVDGMVGTLAYMAPEQAGRAETEVGVHTDVFGLGAVLYEIVTGTYPYHGEAAQDVVARVRACEFTPPQQFSPDIFVPKQVAAIIMKAMARDPADRYASVADLKSDLTRFLHGGLYLPRQVFPPGTKIVTEGDQGDAAYIITRGQCEVYKSINGERRVLRRMGPRSVFGEAAVVSAAPRTATVEAVTEVTVLVLSRAVLEEGLGSDRWESLLVKSLVQRFRELEERFHELERAP